MVASDRAEANRAALSTLVQLAWHDLDQATAYLLTIPRRAAAVRLFCALPLLFAYATLRDLTRIPGALGGPDYVRQVLAPLADVQLLVTGGVDASNARSFIDAGAIAVGVGSALDDPEEARRLVTALRTEPGLPEPGTWPGV